MPPPGKCHYGERDSSQLDSRAHSEALGQLPVHRGGAQPQEMVISTHQFIEHIRMGRGFQEEELSPCWGAEVAAAELRSAEMHGPHLTLMALGRAGPGTLSSSPIPQGLKLSTPVPQKSILQVRKLRPHVLNQ